MGSLTALFTALMVFACVSNGVRAEEPAWAGVKAQEPAVAGVKAQEPAVAGLKAQEPAVAGQWVTQDRRAVVAIEPCGAKVCGRLVGVTLDRVGDPVPLDYQGHPQCGFAVIRDAVPERGTRWAVQIVDPRNGKAYKGDIELDAQRRLAVRGYVGLRLLGQTQVWTRFRGTVGADCGLPPGPVQ